MNTELKTLECLEKECNYFDYFLDNYVPVKAKCSKCGAQLFKDTSIVLTTYPPKNKYVCKSCGNVECSFLNLPQADLN